MCKGGGLCLSISLRSCFSEELNSNLYLRCKRSIPIVSQESKFGFIISNLLTHTDNEYQRPNSSFLFTITPEFKIYSPDVDSDEILYITNTYNINGKGNIECALNNLDINDDTLQFIFRLEGVESVKYSVNGSSEYSILSVYIN